MAKNKTTISAKTTGSDNWVSVSNASKATAEYPTTINKFADRGLVKSKGKGKKRMVWFPGLRALLRGK